MRDLGKWVTMTLRASSRQPKMKDLSGEISKLYMTKLSLFVNINIFRFK